MKLKWLSNLTDNIPFGGNLGLTLALTLFILLSAFFLQKPLKILFFKILHKFTARYSFFHQKILPQVEKPFGMMVTALIWFAVLSFMPPLWKSLGGIPLFLSNPLVGGITIFYKSGYWRWVDLDWL